MTDAFAVHRQLGLDADPVAQFVPPDVRLGLSVDDETSPVDSRDLQISQIRIDRAFSSQISRGEVGESQDDYIGERAEDNPVSLDSVNVYRPAIPWEDQDRTKPGVDRDAFLGSGWGGIAVEEEDE